MKMMERGSRKKPFRPEWLPAGLAILLGLLAWEFASLIMQASIILPSPIETVGRLFSLLGSQKFWISSLWTSVRTLMAFGISLLIALPLGLLMGYNRFAEGFFSLYLAILRSSPVISVILIAMLWFSADLVPIFVALLMVIPLLTGAVCQGVKHQDKTLLEMATSYHWSLYTRIRHIALPTIKPFLQSSSHFALGTAWKACAAAEVLSQPGFGLGSLMQDSRSYLDMAGVFGLTITVILLSLVGDIVLRLSFGNGNKRSSDQTNVPEGAASGQGVPGNPI